MNANELQQYMHRNIPLSRAMEISVVEASGDGITLSAPLAPNINHQSTVFGGSASAVAILSAWALLHVRMLEQKITSRVVIQRNTMSYEKPIVGTFTANAIIPDSATWDKFVAMLARKKVARISVTAMLRCNGEKVGELEGDFVASGYQKNI